MTLTREPFCTNLPVLFETLLYLLSKGKPLGRFDISKMIYFADRKHLLEYGKPITGDSFYAMEHGPVPSKTYDILKVVAGEENQFLETGLLKMSIELLQVDSEGKNFIPKRPPNMDYLSPSAVECLDWAFDHINGKSFSDISEETHQHSGYKNLDPNDMMSFWEIIKDADNYKELKEYIEGI